MAEDEVVDIWIQRGTPNIAASYLRLGGDSMSAIPFHTTSKEDLPHFFNIFRNPEPFGTDFKTVD